MKKMTCWDLGGACDKEFTAETFEELEKLSKEHAMEMISSNDKPHMDAMKKMNELQQSPEELRNWYKNKKRMFDELKPIR